MKKDLKLLLWYILCPTYILWFIWWFVLLIITFITFGLGFRYFPELLDCVGGWPIEALNKLKE
jgi:hypothetical protein